MQKRKKKMAAKSAKGTGTRAKRAAVTVATVLVLRTCNADLTAYGGFQWPSKGVTKAPDWHAGAHCGNGLHGLLWGEGDGGHLNYAPEAKWLVVEVAEKDIVDLNGKVKFPQGKVVFCGDRLGATSYIAERRPGAAICGGTATAGTGGRLEIVFYDYKKDRYRKAIAYVGEDGIKASTKYKLNDSHRFVEVKP